MISGKIYKAYASINKGGKPQEYISIENEFGVLLIDKELFVISFKDEKEIPFYQKELIATL